MVVVSFGSGGSNISCNGNCSNIHGNSSCNSNTSNITLEFNISIILNNPKMYHSVSDVSDKYIDLFM